MPKGRVDWHILPSFSLASLLADEWAHSMQLVHTKECFFFFKEEEILTPMA